MAFEISQLSKLASTPLADTSKIPASFTTTGIITTILFALCVWLLAHFTARRVLPKDSAQKFSFFTAAALIIWFSFVYFFGKLGFFAINPLVAPNIILMFLALFIILQKVYKSASVQKVADAIPQHWIIGVQTYRIVGYGFIILYNLQLLPAEFAFPSGIGDMVVGFSAPFVAYACWKKKSYSTKLAVAWNILGIIDLVVAVSIGILGFPRPLQILPTNPSTDLLSLFPLVFIPCFAVPLALLLHAFSLRALRKNR